MRKFSAPFIVCCVTWFVVSSLCIYPHSLSYFNELIGGPVHGPRHLLGSNVDWGQDLYYLIDCLSNKSEFLGTEIHLSYFGGARAVDLGFPETALEELSAARKEPSRLIESSVNRNEAGAVKQMYCVSVNKLMESQVRQDQQSLKSNELPVVFLRAEEPIYRAGYSIRIYQSH